MSYPQNASAQVIPNALSRLLLHTHVQLFRRSNPPEFCVRILNRLAQLDHWSKDPYLLSETKKSIGVLQTYHRILAEYTQSVQNSIVAIRNAYLPFAFGRGLDSLPDEILQMVFEYIADTKTLSLVSRRFRRIVLDSPRLWGTISNSEVSIPYVVKSLERSKAIPLDIILQLGPADPDRLFCKGDGGLDFLEVLEAVLPHTNRWDNLEICIGFWDWEDAVAPLTEASSHLMNLNLPRLKGLKLCRSMDRNLEDEPLLDPNHVIHFYKSLIVPQLQRLHFINIVPGPIAMSPTLTSCEIEIHSDHIGAIGLRGILTFISSAPALEDLSLFLYCFEINTDEEYPVLVLQNLKFLQLNVADTNSTWVRPFRTAFVTPVIRTFRFIVSAGAYPDDASEGDQYLRFNWLELMLCHDEYPTLEELYAEFEKREYANSQCVYEVPFDKVPNLRVLTLRSERMNPEIPILTNRNHFPALQTINLLSPGCDWRWFLQQVVQRLRAQGKMACLQKLVVSRSACLPQETWSSIQALIPERGIIWSVY